MKFSMSNIKDWLSTLCGIDFLAGGAIVAISLSGVKLPTWLVGLGATLVAASGAVAKVLQGKNPDGSTKTPTQVNEMNAEAANTQPPKTP